MKFLHVADLHIGKKLKGYSLLEDQKFVLNQIIQTALEKKVDGVLIAGDVYDTSIPNIEAVNLFDKFLSDLVLNNINAYIVSGNHDNIHRITFGSNIMSKAGIHFAKKYDGELKPLKLSDNVNIWLLPFIRPMDIREFHPDFQTSNYNEMMKVVIENAKIDETQTNVLVAHQFVTCGAQTPERSESETCSLGTMDNVDVSNFDKFDYVALGHIHKSQPMGRNEVRYAGSPLKYSFSELNQKKQMVILNVQDKKVDLEFIDFKFVNELKEFVGSFEKLSQQEPTDAYVRLVVQDDYILDIKHKLESVFKNIMEIEFDNETTRENNSLTYSEDMENLSPFELFKDFYQQQNNKTMTDEQLKIVQEVFEEMDMEVNA